MDEKLKLPAVGFCRHNIIPGFRILVINFLKCLVIELTTLMLRSTQLEQEICAANKDQDMAKIKLKFASVKVFTRGKITRQL